MSSGVSGVTSLPFTLSAWIYPMAGDVALYDSGFVTIGSTVQGGSYGLKLFEIGYSKFSSDGKVCANLVYWNGNQSFDVQATSLAPVGQNAWHHIVGVFTSNTSRSLYLDGVFQATDTANFNVGNTWGVMVGKTGETTIFNTDIAEVAIWDVALTAADIAILSGAVSPLHVRPQSLVRYCPMIGGGSTEIDLMSGNGLTATGSPTVKTHPRVVVPGPRLLVAKPGLAIPYYGMMI
jgi:hypothetical protein